MERKSVLLVDVLNVEILHEKYGPPDAYVDVLAF